MPSSIRKALDELPTTLDDTYERALQGIPKWKRQHAHRLFQCLVAAFRPLHTEELAEIFAVDFDQGAISNFKEGWRPENPEEAVLSTCSTLITVIEDEGSRIVQFSHFSVKEFLTSDRLGASKVGSIRDYHIPLDFAHTVLARACLAVLLQLDEEVDETRVDKFPLASYATQFWVEHAKYEDVASRVQSSIEELFHPKQSHLTAWVSIHDVAEYWDRGFGFDRAHDPSPPEAASLFYAALCGFNRVANYLIITHAVDVNAEYSNQGAPLHVASRKGHSELVSLLLQHDANVNIGSTCFGNWTPLHFASCLGHAKVAQLLLEHGADVNAETTHYITPLWFASPEGRLEIVRLLLRNGADGESPFEIVRLNGHDDIAQLLVEHGAETE
jgi:Ankyrin repeats (3 copies)